ncbi:hypothetical protein V5O48_012590, partial [Marasmius crinis-equi]
MKFLPVFAGVLSFSTLSAFAANLQVLLNPSGVPLRPDIDWTPWTITNGLASASTTISGVSFNIAAASGTTLKGGQYKITRNNFNGFLGQHMVGQGMSTDATNGSALTLTITGLSTGTHSLLSWHNAWDALQAVTGIDIAVGGTKIFS